MFHEGASVSRVGNDNLFRNGEEISLSWDKWIEDRRWSSHSKAKEYIYIRFVKPNLVKIEVDDSATFVDKRAVVLVGKFLVEIDDSECSFDNKKWIQKKEFFQCIDKYLHYTFESAVEKSLIV